MIDYEQPKNESFDDGWCGWCGEVFVNRSSITGSPDCDKCGKSLATNPPPGTPKAKPVNHPLQTGTFCIGFHGE